MFYTVHCIVYNIYCTCKGFGKANLADFNIYKCFGLMNCFLRDDDFCFWHELSIQDSLLNMYYVHVVFFAKLFVVAFMVKIYLQ